MGQGWKVNSDETLLALFKHAQDVVKEGGTLIFELVETDKRTGQQNRGLHLYFSLLAQDLNKAGYDQLSFPWKEGAKLEWTQESVKQNLWKPIQKAMFSESMTSKLEKKQVSEVYDTLSKNLAEKTGVTTDFPSQYKQELYGDSFDSSSD